MNQEARIRKTYHQWQLFVSSVAGIRLWVMCYSGAQGWKAPALCGIRDEACETQLLVLVEAGAGSSVEAQPGQHRRSDVVREKGVFFLNGPGEHPSSPHSPFLSRACAQHASGLAQCFESEDKREPLVLCTRHQAFMQVTPGWDDSCLPRTASKMH